MTAVCPGSTDGGESFMQFNTNIGGPRSAGSGEVTALLVCSDGVWTFTQNDVTTVITEVNCLVS